MKNRFNFNDDDNFSEEVFEDGESDENYDPSYDGYDQERDEIAQTIELERRDLNSKILFDTIRTLEKSWLWRFRSEKVRNKMIAAAYRINQQLITQGEFQYIDHTREEL